MNAIEEFLTNGNATDLIEYHKDFPNNYIVGLPDVGSVYFSTFDYAVYEPDGSWTGKTQERLISIRGRWKKCKEGHLCGQTNPDWDCAYLRIRQ